MTNSLTGGPVAGATVTLNPAIAGVTISTAADGTYSAELPIGVYVVTFANQNYTSQDKPLSVLAAQSATMNVPLVPVAPVVLNTSLQGTAEPGATLMASVTVTPLDGSSRPDHYLVAEQQCRGGHRKPQRGDHDGRVT